MTVGVKKLIKRSLLVLIPYLLIGIVYIYMDPFQVVFKYKEYYNTNGPFDNIDYVATEIYERNFGESKYDSFIFGSSRSQAFKAKKWETYIKGKPFHFGVMGEGIWGINKKIHYLHQRGIRVKNAIVLLDRSCLGEIKNPSGILFIKHPHTSEEGWESFHLAFVKAFLQDFFFIKYIRYKYFGIEPPAESGVVDRRKMGYDAHYNDVYYEWHDEAIKKDSVAFFNHLSEIISCSKKDTAYDVEYINNKNYYLIEEIADMFKQDNTNVKVILGPFHDRIFFNRSDLKKLQDLFGKENVFDYTGINEFTAHVYNFYDAPHFRPRVANAIMDSIYLQNKTSSKIRVLK